MRHLVALGVAMALATGLAACNGKPQAPKQDAAAFVARLNQDMGALSDELNAAGWTQATYITPDTQLLSARANERYLAYFSKAVAEARQYEQTPKDDATARALALLKLGVSAPAPDDAAKRAELAKLAAGLEAAYGEGKYCVDKGGKQECRNGHGNDGGEKLFFHFHFSDHVVRCIKQNAKFRQLRGLKIHDPQ